MIVGVPISQMDLNTAMELLVIALGFIAVLFGHELGHLVIARLCNVRVSSISIGLGPELLGWTDRAGTRWRVAALLIGGSCTFLDRSNDCVPPKASEYITHKSPLQRIAIFGAGPIVSFILGAVVLVVSLNIHSPEWSWGGIVQSKSAPGLFIAALSLAVGLFNLLPILPLDGGHLLLLGIELARGKPLPPAIERGLHLAGHSAVLVLSVGTLAGLSLVFW